MQLVAHVRYHLVHRVCSARAAPCFGPTADACASTAPAAGSGGRANAASKASAWPPPYAPARASSRGADKGCEQCGVGGRHVDNVGRSVWLSGARVGSRRVVPVSEWVRSAGGK